MCRGTIRRKQDYERAKRKLEKTLNRDPNVHEISAELQIDVTELTKWKHDFAVSQHQSIEEATEAYGDFLFSTDISVEEKIFNVASNEAFIVASIGKLELSINRVTGKATYLTDSLENGQCKLTDRTKF